MKVHVDFSIVTGESDAFGNVSGELRVSTIPQIGDSISFIFAEKGGALDSSLGFSGFLKVVDRIISASSESEQVGIALSTLSVKTNDSALKLMQYFEAEFGLFAVRYEN